MPGFWTKAGRLTPYAFACGLVELHGPHVSLAKEHGDYVIKRGPHHPAGHLIESCCTLTEARRIARAAAKDQP